ncbi:hypothetical protein DRN73_03950 [Candidatus Pacearchaeota archaeon]|nr:MAG: hypothetical protein DRN73_03950 [Candidatus Pacearchaeota archaeon]
MQEEILKENEYKERWEASRVVNLILAGLLIYFGGPEIYSRLKDNRNTKTLPKNSLEKKVEEKGETIWTPTLKSIQAPEYQLRFYQVQQGDYLYSISDKSFSDVKEIVDLNNEIIKYKRDGDEEHLRKIARDYEISLSNVKKRVEGVSLEDLREIDDPDYIQEGQKVPILIKYKNLR